MHEGQSTYSTQEAYNNIIGYYFCQKNIYFIMTSEYCKMFKINSGKKIQKNLTCLLGKFAQILCKRLQNVSTFSSHNLGCIIYLSLSPRRMKT